MWANAAAAYDDDYDDDDDDEYNHDDFDDDYDDRNVLTMIVTILHWSPNVVNLALISGIIIIIVILNLDLWL